MSRLFAQVRHCLTLPEPPTFDETTMTPRKKTYSTTSLSAPKRDEVTETKSLQLLMCVGSRLDLSVQVEDFGSSQQEMERLLLLPHYCALRSACRNMDTLATKLSIAMLRHTDVLPADKAYCESGLDAKVFPWLAHPTSYARSVLLAAAGRRRPPSAADSHSPIVPTKNVITK
ncbi:hypothetical protein B566_EDAN016306, partial [Ephemera danica]